MIFLGSDCFLGELLKVPSTLLLYSLWIWEEGNCLYDLNSWKKNALIFLFIFIDSL